MPPSAARRAHLHPATPSATLIRIGVARLLTLDLPSTPYPHYILGSFSSFASTPLFFHRVDCLVTATTCNRRGKRSLTPSPAFSTSSLSPTTVVIPCNNKFPTHFQNSATDPIKVISSFQYCLNFKRRPRRLPTSCPPPPPLPLPLLLLLLLPWKPTSISTTSARPSRARRWSVPQRCSLISTKTILK